MFDTTTTPDTWARRIEGATLNLATNHYERWTSDDIAFVVAFTDDVTDEEIAYALGRSLYAVWAMQVRIRNGEVATNATRRVDPSRIERSYDYVTTFPPGHFD